MPEGNFALKVQKLLRSADRVLVICEATGMRREGGWFTPADVDNMFQVLHLPAPANLSDSLAQLRTADLVVRHRKGGRWSLSPIGHQRSLGLLESLDYAALDAEIAASPGVPFANAQHTVIHPGFAPAKRTQGISRLLERFPFDTNVFAMTRFPDPSGDQHADAISGVLETVRKAVACHGLTLHLASDRQVDDELFGNVGAYMWACRYGIGLIEDRANRGLNYNLVIELGAMLMAGRRCALLKDRTVANRLPTDLAGHIYKPVDFDDLPAVSDTIHHWVCEDLGLGPCPACRAGGHVT